jgi:V/A-type H+/Na+-transporting ATPase subunit A
MTGARIIRVAGALVEASPVPNAALYELAHVGERRLMAEVVRVAGDTGTLQVYEDTNGLTLGEPVETTGGSLSVTLGPGLLGAVLDGVGRPLARVAEEFGDFIAPGATAPTLDPLMKWNFAPALAAGAAVRGGDVLGTIEERPGMTHRVMAPPGVAGTIKELRGGEFTVADTIGSLADGAPLTLAHRWPVRVPRPSAERRPATRPFITGQRVFDFFFPVAEGGSAAVPGGFGTGKTIIEQSLAKYAEADIVVFVGCGERGNEMTEVLAEFPKLIDARTGRPVMDRAVLIVNTSNMPVAARETSIYLGATIAEYYRDMGYRVALMVDSASRWAEALRELAARLQEMPGEEGYPTHLASRLGSFFERAGRVRAAGSPEREGAVTIIAAISPAGGDFSEPVTQAALRVTGALWALDPSLAHQRHFPAVDWETSYSLYAPLLAPWFAKEIGEDWNTLRRDAMALLQRERELRDIAALVGPEALEDRDRLTLAVASVVREVILRQNANHPVDCWSPAKKTHALATAARALLEAGEAALDAGTPMSKLQIAPAERALAALRDAPEAEMDAAYAVALAAARSIT